MKTTAFKPVSETARSNNMALAMTFRADKHVSSLLTRWLDRSWYSLSDTDRQAFAAASEGDSTVFAQDTTITFQINWEEINLPLFFNRVKAVIVGDIEAVTRS